MRGSLAERLMTQVTIRSDGCWIWTGSLRQGYGQIWTSRDRNGERRLLQAHRASYELARGPIPKGRDLDHLCREPRCVNPDHLEPVTRKENVLRGIGPAAVNAAKDSCPSGHAFDGQYGDGRRRCLTCDPVRPSAGACAHCAGDFEQTGPGRARRFCSDRCRDSFHNERRRVG